MSAPDPGPAPAVPWYQTRHLPLVVVLAPLLVFLIQELVQIRTPSAAWGDWSVLELSTRRAAAGHLRVGPYSRYGWNHPGPMLFYWSVPFHRLADGYFGGLAVAALVLNTIWIAVIVVAVEAAAGWRSAWLTTGVFLVWFLAYDLERLREPWNPLLLVLPVVAVAVCGAAVTAGVRWALSVGAVAGSFAVQTHVGAAPLLAVLAMVTVIGWWRCQRRDLRRWRGPASLTVVLVAVLWMLPAWEQVTADPGNLTEIFRFFRHPAERPGLTEALTLAVRQLSGLEGDLGRSIGATSRLRPLSVVQLVGLVVLVGATGAGIRRARRRADAFWATLGIAALATAVASVVATTRTTAPLMPYLTSGTLGVSWLLWLCAARELAAWTGDRWLRREVGASARRGLAVAAVVALVALVAGSTIRVAGLAGYGAQTRDPDLAAMTEAVVASVGSGHPVVGFVLADHGTWPAIATAAAATARHGSPVVGPSGWEFMFGPAPGEAEVQFLFSDGPVPGPIDGELVFVGPPDGLVADLHVYRLHRLMRFAD